MDTLKLKNQICFPLYIASKEIIKKYKPYLEPLDLTYTQYIVMLVLWEEKEILMKDLCKKLYLDSNTLTPVINKLICKGYALKEKSVEDERVMLISLTDKGILLKKEAEHIPECIFNLTDMNYEEAKALYDALYLVIGRLTKGDEE